MKYTCPCCGYKTLHEKPPGTYDICPICFWEDDPVQFDDPSYEGGANHPVSLRQAQRNFREFGAVERRLLEHIRKPTLSDERDPEWRPFTEGILTKREAERFLKERGRLLKTEQGRKLSKILFAIDPMDLRQFDVPEDEYDSEAEMIVQRLAAGDSLSVDLVREIFERMFSKDFLDHHSNRRELESVVKAITPLLNEITRKRA